MNHAGGGGGGGGGAEGHVAPDDDEGIADLYVSHQRVNNYTVRVPRLMYMRPDAGPKRMNPRLPSGRVC